MHAEGSRSKPRWQRTAAAGALAIILAAVLSASCAGLMATRPSVPMVTTADGRDYFPVVHSLLPDAQRSIDVILYQSRFYFEYPLSASNILIADLADASERGVRVRVVLEIADWNYGNSEDNRDVRTLLKEAGVETYFDPIGTTSHSKLLVVDGIYSVVGSMNWSYYALEKNVEATAVIESEPVGKAFTDYFDGVVRTSTRDYALPLQEITAPDLPEARGEDVLVSDVVDSAAYSRADSVGWLHMGGVDVVVEDDALDETLALDSLFFEQARGDTVRVFGETDRTTRGLVRAYDLKAGDTYEAMTGAFTAERARLRSLSLSKPVLAWTAATDVAALPNEAYAPEVDKLIRGARERVWLALLDARYYETRPAYAESTPQMGPDGKELPSLSNALLADLVDAAGRGVDVRLVIDMGRGGTAPESKTAFLDRLRAAGGKVYEDSPDVTTHAKLMIVDDDFTVVGSTNWSQPALEENNETAAVIEARDINAHYAKLIELAAAGSWDTGSGAGLPRRRGGGLPGSSGGGLPSPGDEP
jgi:phosphatidylserine/phosphatidylglycerophosphate/cardiolipin synthase-like enzyme